MTPPPQDPQRQPPQSSPTRRFRAGYPLQQSPQWPPGEPDHDPSDTYPPPPAAPATPAAMGTRKLLVIIGAGTVSPGPTSSAPAVAVAGAPVVSQSAQAPPALKSGGSAPSRRRTAPRAGSHPRLTASAATASDLANAMAGAGTVVTGASYVSGPPGADATMVSSQPLAGFPRDGATFAILSTGRAADAYTPNNAPNTTTDFGGPPVRGNTDFDVTVLKVDVDVPATANCLYGVDFRFFSEEYPEWVGTSFNDAFIAEVDESTWTTSGSTISAPRNFAFDANGNPITINAAGVTSMTAAGGAGTTYDGGTPILSAATPLSPGPHSLYFSIFDQGDRKYDSTVLIDNVRIGTVANPADCRPGAKPIDPGAPPVRPPAGPGGGGGPTSGAGNALPVTGMPVAGMVVAGVVTTALGATLMISLRRRKTTS